MADAKKPAGKGGDKKPEAKPLFDLSIEGFFFLALVVFLVILVSSAFAKALNINSKTATPVLMNFKIWFVSFFSHSVTNLTFISIFLTLIFIMAAFYAKFRRDEIIAMAKYKSTQMLSGAKMPIIKNTTQSNAVSNAGPNGGAMNLPGAEPVLDSGLATVAPSGTNQWKQIEKYMQSNNESDWRLAIMEADILLYDMLEQIGFVGDSIGDKLKTANSASFNTLNLAWDAHKVRNLIAHDGSSYKLSYEDARRTIGQYKRVFDEFYFI